MAISYPDCAPELFCCFDQPDLTATFRFAVRVPDGWECVANGQLAGREGDVCTFTPVSGMRPYDLTFCAGPFSAAARTQAGRTEVTVRHRRSLLGQPAVAALPQFAGYARDAIAWYADNLGRAVPLPRLRHRVHAGPGRPGAVGPRPDGGEREAARAAGRRRRPAQRDDLRA